jgi:Response regulator containing CheY-like receiver, AAA-type ATPase, and DNA-binding domains
MCRILIVDDDDSVRVALARRLQREGYDVDQAASESEGSRAIAGSDRGYDVVITDMSMDDSESGVRILEAAVARDVFTEVIVLTAYGNVANAVECMKRGAFDYVEKSLPGVDVFELLVLKVEQAAQRRRQALQTVRRLEQFPRTPPA